ncbi:hypothetical protein [Oryzisolibacter propanilivorax]|uniref:hypothetical protein n=1 Tax=Oryzisolibacter propanilivorax TaxID=1527607 RepID=UPI00158763BB|nr:hypothetical protein [Oryzisolibacter propanilivorax]
MLAHIFAIDVAAFAVMGNHYHVMLRIDHERAARWSADEVLQRWTQLFTGPLLCWCNAICPQHARPWARASRTRCVSWQRSTARGCVTCRGV